MERVGLVSTTRCSASAGPHFDRTTTVLLAFAYLVLDLLALAKGRSGLRLDFGVMDKYIVTAIVGDDKTVSFPLVEPFYCTCAHVFFSLSPCIGLRHNILVSYYEYALEELRYTLHKTLY